jgi:hypothetical protein
MLNFICSACFLQATRHAELEAIDKMLADHGGDVSKVQFHRWAGSCTAARHAAAAAFSTTWLMLQLQGMQLPLTSASI